MTAAAAAEAEAAVRQRQRQRVLEGVRAVMLACSVLERSDELRPRYRAALSRAHTTPSYLLGLLGSARPARCARPVRPARDLQSLTRLGLFDQTGRAYSETLSWAGSRMPVALNIETNILVHGMHGHTLVYIYIFV